MLPRAEYQAVGTRLRARLEGAYRLAFATELYWTRLREPTESK
jgi:hypothetical protein